MIFFFFFQAEDGIRDKLVTGVQTCALPISSPTNGARKRGRSPTRVNTAPGSYSTLTRSSTAPIDRLPGKRLSAHYVSAGRERKRSGGRGVDRKSTRLNSSH